MNTQHESGNTCNLLLEMNELLRVLIIKEN